MSREAVSPYLPASHPHLHCSIGVNKSCSSAVAATQLHRSTRLTNRCQATAAGPESKQSRGRTVRLRLRPVCWSHGVCVQHAIDRAYIYPIAEGDALRRRGVGTYTIVEGPQLAERLITRRATTTSATAMAALFGHPMIRFILPWGSCF